MVDAEGFETPVTWLQTRCSSKRS